MNPVESPKITVIVVNWNGEAVIGECLESLTNQSMPPAQVVVVDNGSTDNSLGVIHSFDGRLPLTVIPTGENLGFGKANNLGFQVSKGDLIALLNNDAVADSRWLEEMVLTMKRHPRCGIVASKLLVYGEAIIDSAGDGFSTVLKGFKMGEGKPASCRSQEERVVGACAGGALYKRECIEDVGFFDEDFFLIWEDMDLSMRAWWRGWEVWYSPKAVVHHKVRSSIVTNSPLSVYYTVRNTTFVRVKNLPVSVFLRCLLIYLLGEVAMFLYFCVKLGEWVPYFKGKFDGLLALPELLEKRREILGNATCSVEQFYSMFTPITKREIIAAKLRKFWAPTAGGS